MWSRLRSTGSACCATASRTKVDLRNRRRRVGPSLARRRRRRDDQLDRVVRVPLGRASNGRDLAALAVDEHRGRHPQRAAYALKILKYLGFFVVEKAESG